MTEINNFVQIYVPEDSIVLRFNDGYHEMAYFKEWWQLVGERLFDTYWKSECQRKVDDDIPF